jgi:hypothetical protein
MAMTMLIVAIVTVIAVMFITYSNMDTRANVADMGSDANFRARGRCAQ